MTPDYSLKLSEDAYLAWQSIVRRNAEHRARYGCVLCRSKEPCHCWDNFPTDSDLFGVSFVGPNGEDL